MGGAEAFRPTHTPTHSLPRSFSGELGETSGDGFAEKSGCFGAFNKGNERIEPQEPPFTYQDGEGGRLASLQEKAGETSPGIFLSA